jgi:hypothetical protein
MLSLSRKSCKGTRYGRSAGGRDSESAKIALFDAMKDLPAYLRTSLTWEPGHASARSCLLGTKSHLHLPMNKFTAYW